MRLFVFVSLALLGACSNKSDKVAEAEVADSAADTAMISEPIAPEPAPAPAKVLPPMAASAASYCDTGEEKWISGCSASCTASWSGSDCPKSCTTTPPPGYILVNHRINMTSESNGGHSASVMPADGSYSYASTIKAAYTSAIDAAGKYGDKEVEGRLKEEMNQALEIAESYKTSHQTVRFEVNASKHGSMFDRKRGWSEGNVEMLIKCAVPENLQQKLYEKYGLK